MTDFFSNMRMLKATFVLLLAQCAAQPHWVIDQQATVTCYHCDPHARHFPACLSEPVTCHPDEVCSISYGIGLPTIKCEKSDACLHDVSHPMGICSGGGVEIHPDQCELCCHTAACVQEINGLLLQEFPYQTVNQGLFCPGSCLETDIATCVRTATYCHADQFCEVGIDDHLMVQGHCKNAHELQKCQDDKARHPCVLTIGQPGHIAKCVWDCCQNKECLIGHFGAFMGLGVFSQTVLPQQVLTLAPSATQPSIISPVTCVHCDGYCPNQTTSISCPTGFCSFTLIDSRDGSRSFQKGCSTLEQCHNDWLGGWNKNPLCLAYISNPTKVSGQENTCSFCCTGDKCNDVITDTSVIYGVHL